MKKLLLAILVCSIGLLNTGCFESNADTVSVTKTFEWTATGDDGIIGTATAYSLRYSVSADSLNSAWDVLLEVPNMPTPSLPLTKDSVTVTLLLESETSYFFAIKVVDNAGNWSEISNIVELVVPDTVAPLSVSDLTIK